MERPSHTATEAIVPRIPLPAACLRAPFRETSCRAWISDPVGAGTRVNLVLELDGDDWGTTSTGAVERRSRPRGNAQGDPQDAAGPADALAGAAAGASSSARSSCEEEAPDAAAEPRGPRREDEEDAAANKSRARRSSLYRAARSAGVEPEAQRTEASAPWSSNNVAIASSPRAAQRCKPVDPSRRVAFAAAPRSRRSRATRSALWSHATCSGVSESAASDFASTAAPASSSTVAASTASVAAAAWSADWPCCESKARWITRPSPGAQSRMACRHATVAEDRPPAAITARCAALRPRASHAIGSAPWYSSTLTAAVLPRDAATWSAV
mmetsp:Transcript_23208/g.92069  ORF Transcript_23208/g.92069 Transcript_23208/m.92069 type:complete len:327 (+) Transcript_23208:1750-2730(+)